MGTTPEDETIVSMSIALLTTSSALLTRSSICTSVACKVFHKYVEQTVHQSHSVSDVQFVTCDVRQRERDVTEQRMK